MSSHLERRLAVQLAGKTVDELVAMIARQQIRHEEEKAKLTAAAAKPTDGRTEIELQERLAIVYYGEQSDKTIEEMITDMEREANKIGYALKVYLRRFTDSGSRRRG